MATVNKPLDPKQKEADVNRKLQIYGIVNAFQTGKVPSVSTLKTTYNSANVSVAEMADITLE